MKKYYWIGIGSIVVVFLFYVFVMAIVGRQPLSMSTETWGYFGSYFGGITGPILSFLAFIILAKTLSIQQTMATSQASEQDKQQKLTELDFCYKNLERLESQVDKMLNEKANKLGGKTILEVLGNTTEENIDKSNKNIIESATALIGILSALSYLIYDIEKRLKSYYPEDEELSILGYKTYWILKYRPIANNCLHVIPAKDISTEKRENLKNGLCV
jgi:hypothetical protein